MVKGIVAKIEAKMEVEIVANEERLANGQLETMSIEKKSHFISQNQIELFKIKREGDLIKISIKGNKVSINLFANEAYLKELTAMENAIGKG